MLSPFLSLVAAYAAIGLFAVLVSLAILVFGVEMLRASVLPVAPLALVIAGPFLLLVYGVIAIGVSLAGVNIDELPVALIVAPIAVTSVGLAWLGWHLSQETAVDRARSRPLAST